MSWTAGFPLAALPRGEARVITHEGQRIAVFHLDDGELAAIDDRCPHEGYPLAKGFVNGCVVTCRWHAFRYDLKTGQCLVGDEHARIYPVRVHEGEVQVDLAPFDRDMARARAEASLVRGLERRRGGQVARDVVRLLDAGASAREVVMQAVRFESSRAPYGTAHVPALAYDMLGLLPRLTARHGADGEVAAILQPLDLAADSLVGYAERARPEAEAWDPATLSDELRRRVEAEDADGAEALVRGAVTAGVELAVLRRWFRDLTCDHLLDFGHGQIYLPKVFGLLEAVGRAGAAATECELLLGAFVRAIALGTREELVPDWAWVVRAIEAPVAPDLAVRGLTWALLDGSRKELFASLESALATMSYEAISDALVIAASIRLLRYDLQIESDPTIQEGWLDVTHALTLASATRDLIDPDAPAGNRRILYFAAAFVHTRGGLDAPLDLRVFDETILESSVGAEPARPDLDRVLAALEHRGADAMVHAATAVCAADPEALVVALEDHCLLRGATRPIFATHQWKTLVAATHEHGLLATRPAHARLAHLPLLAAARFIAAPLAERSPVRLAHEALRFVRESRVPRRRT